MGRCSRSERHIAPVEDPGARRAPGSRTGATTSPAARPSGLHERSEVGMREVELNRNDVRLDGAEIEGGLLDDEASLIPLRSAGGVALIATTALASSIAAF